MVTQFLTGLQEHYWQRLRAVLEEDEERELSRSAKEQRPRGGEDADHNVRESAWKLGLLAGEEEGT